MHPFFLLFSIFLFILPLSIFCQDDDFRYSNCSEVFNCGRIKNIGYPFWGGNRPDYCGHLKLRLQCQNGEPMIKILSETYRVSEINQSNQTLHIKTTNFWNGTCPTQFRSSNTTIDNTVFSYADSTRNLTVFYDCGVLLSANSTQFSCRKNGTTTTGTVSDRPEAMYPELQRCKLVIRIPTALNFTASRSMMEVVEAGFELKYKVDGVTTCKECQKSGGQCGSNITTGALICLCRDGSSSLKCSQKGRNEGGKIGTAVTVIVVAGVVIWCCLRRRSNLSLTVWKRNRKNAKDVEAFLRDSGLSGLKRYKYKDVKKITNSFKDKIGQGGYGTVFKGNLSDGRTVAVKMLNEIKSNGNDFINEVASISKTSHVNIVTLLGFCVKRTKRALIYEFMPNGSLEKFISNASPLSTQLHLGWETLYKIAVGIAQGLEYLHRGCNTRILHFDIKPHNILLDQDFNPKIADFGLSKLSHVKESIISMSGARGTPGYIAPELVSRLFGASHKSDVYSYGMLVLEMAGGKKKLDLRLTDDSEIYFPNWIYKRLELNEDIGFQGITSSEDQEIAQKMILVGLWCIQVDPSSRPPMSKVLNMLGGSLEALQVPPKPSLLSPMREEEGSWSTISTM